MIGQDVGYEVAQYLIKRVQQQASSFPAFDRKLDAMNVSDFLQRQAAEQPESIAIAEPIKGRRQRRDLPLKERYRCMTFKEFGRQHRLDRLAMGVTERLALMIPPSCEFVSWVFALFKAGVVTVLIDPGMGKERSIASSR